MNADKKSKNNNTKQSLPLVFLFVCIRDDSWPKRFSVLGLGVQFFLDAAHNVGRGAIQVVFGGTLGRIKYRPDHLVRLGVYQEYRAFCPAKPRAEGRIA